MSHPETLPGGRERGEAGVKERSHYHIPFAEACVMLLGISPNTIIVDDALLEADF